MCSVQCKGCCLAGALYRSVLFLGFCVAHRIGVLCSDEYHAELFAHCIDCSVEMQCDVCSI